MPLSRLASVCFVGCSAASSAVSLSPPVCCTLLPCSAAPSTSGSLRSFAGKTSCVFYVDPVCATVADCKCKPLAEWLPGDILSYVLPRQTTPLDYLVYCRPSAVNDSKSGRCPPSLSQFLVARIDDGTTHLKILGPPKGGLL